MGNGIAHEFPERLNRWIKRNGFTEQTFAERIGIPDNVIRAWCEGDLMPNVVELRIIAFCTGISADWWLGLKKLPTDDSEVDKLRNSYHDVVHENAQLHSKVYDMERKMQEAERLKDEAEAELRRLKATVTDRFISVMMEV